MPFVQLTGVASSEALTEGGGRRRHAKTDHVMDSPTDDSQSCPSERLLPGRHLQVDAADQGAVYVEEQPGGRRSGPAHQASTADDTVSPLSGAPVCRRRCTSPFSTTRVRCTTARGPVRRHARRLLPGVTGAARSCGEDGGGLAELLELCHARHMVKGMVEQDRVGRVAAQRSAVAATRDRPQQHVGGLGPPDRDSIHAADANRRTPLRRARPLINLPWRRYSLGTIPAAEDRRGLRRCHSATGWPRLHFAAQGP